MGLLEDMLAKKPIQKRVDRRATLIKNEAMLPHPLPAFRVLRNSGLVFDWGGGGGMRNPNPYTLFLY